MTHRDMPGPGVAADRNTARVRVLYADDNAPCRVAMSEVLSVGIDADVVTVNDGAAAVASWWTEPFDLVLMDVHMPIMDGLAALRCIRALEAESGRTPTPVIAVTADATPARVAEYVAAGVAEVVAKPIEPARVFAALSRVLDADHRRSAA